MAWHELKKPWQTVRQLNEGVEINFPPNILLCRCRAIHQVYPFLQHGQMKRSPSAHAWTPSMTSLFRLQRIRKSQVGEEGVSAPEGGGVRTIREIERRPDKASSHNNGSSLKSCPWATSDACLHRCIAWPCVQASSHMDNTSMAQWRIAMARCTLAPASMKQKELILWQ